MARGVSSLLPGERVVFKTRTHLIALLRPLVGLLACGLYLGRVALAAMGEVELALPPILAQPYMLLTAVFSVIALLCYLPGALMRFLTFSGKVTSKRVLLGVGLFWRRTVTMPLHQAESLQVELPLLGRLLGYGQVIVTGTGGSQETFEDVCRPQELWLTVQEQVEAQRQAQTMAIPVAQVVMPAGAVPRPPLSHSRKSGS